jgi:outer membrane immunogenic protein
MKKLVLAGVVLGALMAPAMAGDMPVPAYMKAPAPPPFSWTGLYLGGNAGWGTIDDDALPFCLDPTGAYQGPGCDVVPGGRVRGNGFVGGGQIGYNWQVSRLVVGLESDMQGTNLKGTTNVAGPFEIIGFGSSGPGVSFTAEEKIAWIGTLRGRLGVAFDTLMIYATGGFAYGGVNVSQAHIFPAVHYPSSASRNLNGWTFGGGVEWAFLGNLSARVEGLYYDLGTLSTSNGPVPAFSPAFVAGKNFDAQGAIVRAGLNWRFGEPVFSPGF